jgi:hypothetical protein
VHLNRPAKLRARRVPPSWPLTVDRGDHPTIDHRERLWDCGERIAIKRAPKLTPSVSIGSGCARARLLPSRCREWPRGESNVFETAIEPSPELRFACATQSFR